MNRADTLRGLLKQETKRLHEELDRELGPLALGDVPAYAAFLKVQYAARRPIEAWASDNLTEEMAPPSVLDALQSDLESIGASLPEPSRFRFPEGGDARGLAWALGGSSLGNRALLAQRRRRGLQDADAFLSDPASAEYFIRIKPSLEQPDDLLRAGSAIAAANAVFACFLAALEDVSMLRVAA